MDYEELQKVAEMFKFDVKELACTLNNTQEFWDWYYNVQEENYKYNEEFIEGFVIEDSNGFMVKIKLDYYNTWKFMRGVLEQVRRMGYITRTSSLTTKLHNDFYNWCVANKEKLPQNIIDAREVFENEQRKNDNEKS